MGQRQVAGADRQNAPATEWYEGLSVRIMPLRNMVLVRLEPEAPLSGLQVIRPERVVRPAKILACGPEVRDLAPDMVALVNIVTATQVDGCYLVPAPSILGTL